jgi:hypothetical protein
MTRHDKPTDLWLHWCLQTTVIAMARPWDKNWNVRHWVSSQNEVNQKLNQQQEWEGWPATVKRNCHQLTHSNINQAKGDVTDAKETTDHLPCGYYQ